VSRNDKSHTPKHHPQPEDEGFESIQPGDCFAPEGEDRSPRQEYMPLHVVIMTDEYEIDGLVHVSRKVKEERRLSDLLNNPERRFLAVTDAHVTYRNAGGTPRRFQFLQLRIDDIRMMHPSTQTWLSHRSYSEHDSKKFDKLRSKVNSIPD
jgi:hypothetical protein